MAIKIITLWLWLFIGLLNISQKEVKKSSYVLVWVVLVVQLVANIAEVM